MGSKIRLKDIADQLSVSQVTVSNALSGKKGVSEQLRREILEKAETLGFETERYYRKNRKKAYTIGMIALRNYFSEGTSFYWEMYQAAANAAYVKKTLSTLEVLQSDEPEAPLPRLLSVKMIDGLIVIGALNKDYLKRLLQAVKVPVVFLDFYSSDLNVSSVLSNNYFGMYRMTRYLIMHGHREIGFVGTPERSVNIEARYYGFVRAMEEAGLRVDEEWLLKDRDPVTEDGDVELPVRLPTAFVCSSDYAASLLYARLCQRNIRIPEDISLVGYDNYVYNDALAGILTTQDVDKVRMGREAFRMLSKMMSGETVMPAVHYVDGKLLERGSVKNV